MKTNTINKKEIEKFSKIAEEWWNPHGKFRPLHKFNPIRIAYIKDSITETFKLKNISKPLKNNIEIAELHAKKNNLNIKYYCTSPEKFKPSIKFDVILNMEIIEHVDNVEFYLKACSNLLKRNGVMFVATLNKTLKSYLFAIIGAEYILRWLPIGTHEWEKFVKPEDLINILKNHNLKMNKIDGVKLDLIKNNWKLSSDKSVNYIAEFIKY